MFMNGPKTARSKLEARILENARILCLDDGDCFAHLNTDNSTVARGRATPSPLPGIISLELQMAVA